MTEKHENKYSIDYSTFIKNVENITGLSPADLLHSYEEFISGLNEYENVENYSEWQYEFDYDAYIRIEIEKVVSNVELSNNTFLKQFKDKVELLDSQFKKFLKNGDDDKWWETPKIKFQN
ncbi:hypothetical protein HYN48_14115 [Flavobacterium magnum]|uniref:Uncharacterized protein n=1 Tax=Flavobacterium magnum TaxID=2162713 RepID=A0A2S0RHP1_9FLAO|nr:hypothetical protein [Flavobacterium magnum]AWA31135.1 hypothetical protein HYN48_14115 [Flavobacterium magnum]